MERRRFTREFKLEAVKLIKERGVGYLQAARDLGVHQSVLRNWVKGFEAGPAAFISGPRSDEAGAAGDRAAQAGCSVTLFCISEADRWNNSSEGKPGQ